jgi:hypothetical protein
MVMKDGKIEKRKEGKKKRKRRLILRHSAT